MSEPTGNPRVDRLLEQYDAWIAPDDRRLPEYLKEKLRVRRDVLWATSVKYPDKVEEIIDELFTPEIKELLGL